MHIKINKNFFTTNEIVETKLLEPEEKHLRLLLESEGQSKNEIEKQILKVKEKFEKTQKVNKFNIKHTNWGAFLMEEDISIPVKFISYKIVKNKNP